MRPAIGRDKVLLVLAIFALALWLSAAGPIRWAVEGSTVRLPWILGVLPNFLAGITLTCWQAFLTRTSPVASAVFAVAVLGIAEAAQLLLPSYRADWWDVAASATGALLAIPVLLWRAKRYPAA
jgi:hypothetical protein